MFCDRSTSRLALHIIIKPFRGGILRDNFQRLLNSHRDVKICEEKNDRQGFLAINVGLSFGNNNYCLLIENDEIFSSFARFFRLSSRRVASTSPLEKVLL